MTVGLGELDGFHDFIQLLEVKSVKFRNGEAKAGVSKSYQ
jgi:hypothetical protein